jgi:serine/threonine protein kinase
LKPSNILDFSTPDKIDIKVCDFDMCTPDIITYQWAKAMTVEYCPPEILKQNHEVTYTKKVDTWSAGLILYYMVKGTTIFRRNSLEGK